jgi:16S rRNA processing protein RimM
MMKKIPIGKIVRAFGIKGEVKVALLTDIPTEQFVVDQTLEVEVNSNLQEVVIESFRMHQNHGLLKFKGLDSINDVLEFVSGSLLIEVDPSQEQRVTYFDCIGCTVMEDTNTIGTVVDVLDMPAHPVLKVDTKTKMIMIPLVDAFVLNVDKEKNIIHIQSIEGLL